MKSNPLKLYSTGLFFLIQGTKDLFKIPGLLQWAAVPFLIDVMLLIFGLFWSKGQIPQWRNQLLNYLPGDPNGWLHFLISPLTSFLLWIALMGILFYGVFLLTTIIAAPFNAIIAEKTLAHYQIADNKKFHLNRWLTTSLRMLRISIIKTILFLIVSVILFFLSFIPIINFIAIFATLLIIAFDSMDYSFEMMEMNLSQRFKYFKSHLPEFCGMATVLGGSLLIPGLTFLLLPSAVAGSAWVMSQSEAKHDSKSSA